MGVKDGTILVDADGTFWEVYHTGEKVLELCYEDAAWSMKIGELGDCRIVAESGEKLFELLASDHMLAAKITAGAHERGDRILKEIATAFGFHQTVEAFENLEKCYA